MNLDEIIKNNEWDYISVAIDDGNDVIYQSFTTEYSFQQFMEDNLSKYIIELKGYSVILDQKTQKKALRFNFYYDFSTRRLSTQYIKQLASDIMLRINQEDIDDIQGTESKLREKFLNVLKIDTKDIKAKYYPFDAHHTYLRDDDEFEVLDHDMVLENAPEIDHDYITIVKVVK